MNTYVHGYHAHESQRLQDQADTLVELLHADTAYPDGCHVLEAGCGTGAQTATLARRSPGAHFTCVDWSAASLQEARQRCGKLANVDFQQHDLRALPFPAASFDHVFVCFVLEHLHDPAEVLRSLAKVLRPGGTLTAIEGDHGSTLFHPESPAARHVIDCQVRLQAAVGGNALIGRTLHPLLQAAGFDAIQVSPRIVYADASRPFRVQGFTLDTFTAMVEGVREPAIAQGLSTPAAFDAGLAALRRTAEADGVFSYTFFKAVAKKR